MTGHDPFETAITLSLKVYSAEESRSLGLPESVSKILPVGSVCLPGFRPLLTEGLSESGLLNVQAQGREAGLPA
jgi:hypothetical protein